MGTNSRGSSSPQSSEGNNTRGTNKLVTHYPAILVMRTRPNWSSCLVILPVPTTWQGHSLLSGNVFKKLQIPVQPVPFSKMKERNSQLRTDVQLMAPVELRDPWKTARTLVTVLIRAY